VRFFSKTVGRCRRKKLAHQAKNFQKISKNVHFPKEKCDFFKNRSPLAKNSAGGDFFQNASKNIHFPKETAIFLKTIARCRRKKLPPQAIFFKMPLKMYVFLTKDVTCFKNCTPLQAKNSTEG